MDWVGLQSDVHLVALLIEEKSSIYGEESSLSSGIVLGKVRYDIIIPEAAVHIRYMGVAAFDNPRSHSET